MIWILVLLALYTLALPAIMLASVRPLRTPAISSPGAMGAPQQSVTIPSTDGLELSGWWVEAPDAKGVAILAHGYFMSKGELAPVAYWLWEHGISCLLFDFRAHGKTRGGVCTFGYKERHDLTAAVRFARERAPGLKTFAVGSSMGSVASAFAWADDPDLLDGLVLDSAYGRLTRAILGWWRFLGGTFLTVVLSPTVLVGGPLAGINPFKVDVADALTRLRDKPVLLMHGTRDTLAEKSEAERNLAMLGQGTEAVWFEGCGHSEGRWEQPGLYHAALRAYLGRIGVLDAI